MKRESISAVALNIGLLLIVAGTIMPLLHAVGPMYKYVYAAGAVLAFVGRFINLRRDGSLRLRRLYRLEAWSVLLFAVAVFFMFYPCAGATDWIAFTLAGGFVQAYSSIMIGRQLRKDGK